jgi:hypothetical protein
VARAIERRDILRADYRRFDGKRGSYEIEPLHLLAYHGNWYVLARSRGNDKTFAQSAGSESSCLEVPGDPAQTAQFRFASRQGNGLSCSHESGRKSPDGKISRGGVGSRLEVDPGGRTACAASAAARVCLQGENLGGLRPLARFPTQSPALVKEPGETGPLLRVCGLLNAAGANYLVAGAYAMILNSVIRATEDVDILIEDSRENFQKVITALSNLADGAARELTPEDFVENVVVKIADEVEVDVSTSAWTVTYAKAAKNAQSVVIDHVRIPYLSLDDLIRSKLTHREQDHADVERLRRLR